MNSKLYVGNLSYTTTEDTLWNLFSQSGTVVAVDLIKDRVTRRSKGYAFIMMGNPVEAETAVEALDGYSVDDNQISVSLVQRREDPTDFSNGDSSHLPRSSNRKSSKR